MCTKFLVPVVTRPTWAKLEGSVESDYRNMRLKWNPKQDAHSLVTRSLRASSSTEHNKSALTEHATQENHVINWSQATVIDRQPECFTRWIKEAIHVRKEGQQAMNHDEGSYQLSHAYDCFLVTLRHNMLRCLTLSLPSPSNTALTDSHLW